MPHPETSPTAGADADPREIGGVVGSAADAAATAGAGVCVAPPAAPGGASTADVTRAVRGVPETRGPGSRTDPDSLWREPERPDPGTRAPRSESGGSATTPREPADPVPAERDLSGRVDLASALTPSADDPETALDPDSGPGLSANATACIDATAVPTPTATAAIRPRWNGFSGRTRIQPASAHRSRPEAVDELIT